MHMSEHPAPLRSIRVMRGLSQRELARRMGLSASLVCRVEVGAIRPWPKFCREAAAVLGVDQALLFGGTRETSAAGGGRPSLDPEQILGTAPATHSGRRRLGL